MTVTSRFLLLGEPLTLDLVNTRVRRDGALLDLLDTPAALAAWLCAERGRLIWTGAVGAEDVTALCALRAAMGELLAALRKRVQPGAVALAVVNQALANPAAPPRMVWSADGPQLQTRAPDAQRSAALHALALDAVTLLTGRDAQRIRQCAHADCILQFVARNPRRRWCSSTRCGNRARVSRHYHVHRRADQTGD